MTKRKNQGLILLTISVPMMWWGLSNIISETPSSNILAIMISISATFGGLFAISGLVMLATKNSLGIWDIDDKEKGRGEGLLVSQTKVKDSPIKKEIINQPTKKVNEMAKVKATKDTHVADAVKEFREIGQSMKDGATRRANIRARLKEMGIAIDEDGKIDV